MKIRPYLFFKGECGEAIELYKRAFNTDTIEVMCFSDMPQRPGAQPISEYQKRWILQATIRFGDNFLRLSDSMGDINDARSERFAIVVECSAEEVKHAFAVLSEDGEIDMPLQQTFFSSCYGIVADKYGVMWNLAAV
jgi:PhnB protein